jgi:hypothetical protein
MTKTSNTVWLIIAIVTAAVNFVLLATGLAFRPTLNAVWLFLLGGVIVSFLYERRDMR